MDDVQEPLPRLLVFGIVEQGLGVALDGSERRAELVRDVGDEIAADLIGRLQVRDVVQHEDGAAPFGHHRRDVGHQRAAAVQYQVQLEAFGIVAAQRSPDLFGDAGVTERLEVRAARGLTIQLQQAARGFVDQLQAALPIHDQHALDHAGEDGLHACPVTGEIVDPASQLLNGRIHRARDPTQVVVAIIRGGPAQVAQRVAAGDGLHRGPRATRGPPRHARFGRPRSPTATVAPMNAAISSSDTAQVGGGSTSL